MRKEILEQPQALAATLENALNHKTEIRDLWKKNDCKRVITLARGSSANAANFAQFIFAEVAQIQAQPQSVEVAIDFKTKLNLSNVLAIAISQSGETKETISALNWAKANGATTLAISNNPNSSLEKISDLAISTFAGKEVAIPATKSFSTALLVLTVVAASVGNHESVIGELKTLPKAVAEALNKTDFDQALKALISATTMISCGSGFTEHTAIEAALKFRETCYLDSIGISAAELQHGTKALFDQDESILIFTSGQSQKANAELEVLAKRALAAGMKPIVFGNFPAGHPYTYIYSEENWSELTSVFTTIAQAQLLVEALAQSRGLNPDTPRNLSKVTQLES